MFVVLAVLVMSATICGNVATLRTHYMIYSSNAVTSVRLVLG